MILIIIAIIQLVVGSYLFASNKMKDSALPVLLLIMSLALTVFASFRIENNLNSVEKLKMADLMINNKRKAIEEMKSTYYAQPENSITDMVNKDLSITIIGSIRELEISINNCNTEIARLRAASKRWFWYPCFVDTSDLKPIEY